MTLGNLPIERWIGRSVLLDNRRTKTAHSGSRHPYIQVRLLAAEPPRRVTIQLPNYTHPEAFTLDAIKPLWAKNPDLAAMRK